MRALHFQSAGLAMKTASLVLWFVISFSLSILLPLPAYPHGGGLDAYGCHHNRGAGSDLRYLRLSW